ncbi:MAG: hypothetical protein FJZ58_03160 [Chlamydiae bacterium]|nr:hypothetical protein [Chlamydiota bacterium]
MIFSPSSLTYFYELAFPPYEKWQKLEDRLHNGQISPSERVSLYHSLQGRTEQRVYMFVLSLLSLFYPEEELTLVRMRSLQERIVAHPSLCQALAEQWACFCSPACKKARLEAGDRMVAFMRDPQANTLSLAGLPLETHQLPACIQSKPFQERLEHLDLSHTDLWNYSPGLQSLSHLRILNLSNNHLEEFPRELFSLPGLQELDLSGNRFLAYTELPLQIQGFSLDTSKNQAVYRRA